MNKVVDVFNLPVNESIECGKAKIHSFCISEEYAAMSKVRAMIHTRPYEEVDSGEHVSLFVDGTLYMSDTQMERISNTPFVRNARGRIMIAGLGIGLILNALKEKIEKGVVTSIVVYEKYQDVIDLVSPYYKELPLEVVCKDILEYTPEKDEMYDTIYFDIWECIEEGVEEKKMLHKRWRRHLNNGGWMSSWFYKSERKAV